MPRKKKLIITITAAVLMLLVSVGLTLAYIVTSSQPVINTFTVGNVAISLSETTGDTYPLLPGITLEKDPTLTVHTGSEACWVFFTIDEPADLPHFISYEIAEGWTLLEEGHTNVYYRQVNATYKDESFPLIKDDTVQVYDTVTEEDLAGLHEQKILNFTGYAIQRNGMTTVHDAWHQLSEEVTDR